MANKHEVLIKVKAELSGFKKSMDEIKKLAKDTVNDIEKSMKMDLTSAGSTAGSSFVKGFNRHTADITKNIKSAIEKVGDTELTVKVKVDADYLTKSIKEAAGSVNVGQGNNTNEQGSSANNMASNLIGLGTMSAVKSLGVINAEDEVLTYAKYVGYVKDGFNKLEPIVKKFNDGLELSADELKTLDDYVTIVKNELNNLSKINFGNNIDQSSLDRFKKKASEILPIAEKINEQLKGSMTNNANAPNMGDINSSINDSSKDSVNDLNSSINDVKKSIDGLINKFNELSNVLDEVIGKLRSMGDSIEPFKNDLKEAVNLAEKLSTTTPKLNPPSSNSGKSPKSNIDDPSGGTGQAFPSISFGVSALEEMSSAASMVKQDIEDVIKASGELVYPIVKAKDAMQQLSFVIDDVDFKVIEDEVEQISSKCHEVKRLVDSWGEISLDFDDGGDNNNLDNMANNTSSIFERMANRIGRILGFIPNLIFKSFNGILNVTNRVASGIGRGFTAAFNGVGRVVSSTTSFIRNRASSIGSAFKSGFSSAINSGRALGANLKNTFNSITKSVNNVKTKITTAFNKIPAPIKAAGSSVMSLAAKFKNIVASHTGLSRIANIIKKIGNNSKDAANKAGGLKNAFKGLIGQFAGMFGLYQGLQWMVQGTKDAMQYEASIMNLQRTLGIASTALTDFANTNATSFGISKKQVAEYGNIFSVIMMQTNKALAKQGDTLDDVAAKTAETSQKLLESAGIISSALGYDTATVLEGLRSALLGSSEAVDQYGLSMKVASLEASESFRQIANGATSWNDLTTAQQQAIIAQEILNQTTAKYGGIVSNTASMHNAFTAQLANTKLALGNVGKAIWTAILPALTKLMAVLEKVFNFVAKVMSAILGLFGIKVQFSGGGGTGGALNDLSGGLGGVSDAAGGAGDALDNAGKAAKNAGSGAKKAAEDTKKAAKEIKRSLAGFDQINILSLGKDSDSDSPGSGSGGSGGGSGSPGSGGGGGAGGGAGNLNDALTDVLFTQDDTLDNLTNKLKEMFDLFKSGFDSVFDYSVFDRLKEDIASIKESLEDIFGDPAVQNAAKKATDAWIVALGKFAGAVATFGFELADGILGGLAKSLDENKGYIKEKLISIFNIQKETAEYFGKLSEGLAEIFRALGSDAAKDLWSQIFSIGIIADLNLEELGNKIGRDLMKFIAIPISDNAGGIRLAFENTFQFLADVLETFKTATIDIFAAIHRVYDDHVKPFTDKITESVSTCVGNLVDGYNTYIAPVLDKLADKFSVVYDEHIKPLIDKLEDFAGTLIDCIAQIWETWVKPFFEWLTSVFFPAIAPALELIGSVALDVLGMVADLLGDLLDILKGLIKFITGVFTGDWKLAWEGVCDILGGVVDLIVDLLKGCWEVIKTIFSPLVNWFKDLFTKAWNGIKNAWKDVTTWFANIWNGIKNVWNVVSNWFKDLFTKAWNNIKTAWSTVKTWFTDLWNNIKKVWDVVANFYKTLFTNAWNNIKTAWSTVKTWFTDLWNGIKKVWDVVADWFKTLFTNAWNNIKTAWSSVKSWFSDLWNGIKNIFSEVANWFKDKFTTAWSNIKSAWSNVKSWFSDIWSSIKNTFSNVGSWFSEKFTAAKDAMLKPFNTVKTKIGDIFDNVKTTVKNAIDKVKGMFNFTWSLPKIKLPHFSITPKGWKFGDLLKGTIPSLGISWYKQGGIMMKPTVFGINGGNFMAGGEAGPEAILPLDKLWSELNRQFQNQTQALNNSLAMSRSASDRPVNITLKIGDIEMGRATVNSLKALAEHTGEIDLPL